MNPILTLTDAQQKVFIACVAHSRVCVDIIGEPQYKKIARLTGVSAKNILEKTWKLLSMGLIDSRWWPTCHGMAACEELGLIPKLTIGEDGFLK